MTFNLKVSALVLTLIFSLSLAANALVPGFLGFNGGSRVARAQESTAKNLTVCFVIDSSGSMRTSDPSDLRLTAVKMFISLLDQGDTVGIVNFSTNSEIRSHLKTIQNISDQSALIATLGGIRPDGYTNMRAALRDAATVLGEDKSDNSRIVLFLTDGKPELPGGVPPNYEADTLNLVKAMGAPVLAVGLTKEGLSPFLSRVAKAGTAGSVVIPASSATEVLDTYLGILGKLKDRTVIGTGTASAPGTVPLQIDPNLASYIDQVSFVAAVSDGVQAHFIQPGGTEVHPGDAGVAQAIAADPRFALLTVPSPRGGAWSVAFSGKGTAQARAIVRSRLRVHAAQPGYTHPVGIPMTITVSLIEEDRPQPPIKSIGDTSFSALIEGPNNSREALDQLYDDGTHGDAKAHDGDFTNVYYNTDVAGAYGVTLTANKGVVRVSSHLQVQLVQFPHIVIDTPSAGTIQVRGPVSITAHLVGGDPPALDQGSLVAHITKPDGSEDQAVTLTTDKGDVFAGSYLPTADGQHNLLITAEDALYQGVPFAERATASFNASLVPILSFDTDKIDLGQTESLVEGQSTALHVKSSGVQTETVTLEVAGLPGAQVSPAQIEVAPRADTNVTVRISSASDLPPKIYNDAKLVLSARSGVSLPKSQIPITLELIAGLLQVSPSESNLGNVDGGIKELIIPVKITSNYPRNDPLQVASIEPAEVSARLDPGTVIGKAATDAKLNLSSKNSWSDGDHRITVRFSKPRPQVAITPDVVSVRFHVPSFLERFGLYGALGIAMLVAAALLLLSRIPSPRGKLVGVKAPSGLAPRTYYLGSYASPLKNPTKKVKIGSGKGNQIKLAAPSVATEHALISGEKRQVTRTVGQGSRTRKVTKAELATVIKPKSRAARCAVNGTPLPSTGQPLKRGDKVQLGDYEFEYQ